MRELLSLLVATGPGGSVVAGSPKKAITTPPFPARYDAVVGPNAALQVALDHSLAQGPGAAWPVPVAIVSLSNRNPDGSHPLAVHRPDEVHFSASLVKVAGMYAVFELRNVLRKIALELGASATTANFLPIAGRYLKPKILAKAASIRALAGIPAALALPNYGAFKAVVASARPGVEVMFSGAFEDHLLKMIRDSNNGSAGRCVHASGYGYLIGALATAGFFDPAAKNGLFLGGDYSGRTQHFVVPAVNTGATAQAATVRQLVRLYTLMADRKLVDDSALGAAGAASDDMLTLLTTTTVRTRYHAPEVYIGRGVTGQNFTVTHNKLGLSRLGICSEASLVTHTASRRRFAVAWQNLHFGADGFGPVTILVHRTLENYLNATGPSW